MKILEVLNEFYGDFEFIKEKWNEKYEGILIKIKEEQGYKRCRLAKKTPKKEGYFTAFWKKDQNNKNENDKIRMYSFDKIKMYK